MGEKDEIIGKVNRLIDEHKERRVVLYGTGNITRWVIEHFLSVKSDIIAEIMDFSYMEDSFMGFSIISEKEAGRLTNDDLIIIMNRNPVISQFIYNRIWRLLPEGALTYGLDGNTFEVSENNELTEGEQSTLDYEEIKKKIEEADVVSFDIFDTLLVRNVEKSTDVYLLMAERVKQKYGISDFPELRKEAEILASEKYISPTLDEIYEALCEICRLDGTETVRKLAQEEIETERHILSLRESNIELLKYCVEIHKEVYLLSDTYYNTDDFFLFFSLNNIDLYKLVDKSHFYLSCELRKSKENGELWNEFAAQLHGRRGLHLGDNQISDICRSKTVGIESICTYSPRDLRRRIAPKAMYKRENALTSIELGHFDSLVYNSPFSNGAKIETHFDYGYRVLGPVIFNYLYWILRREIMSGKEVEGRKVYFLSRDGYFLVKLFDQLSSELGIGLKGVYLYTSRAFLRYINYVPGQNEKTGFIGSLKDYLKYRFNYEISEESGAGRYVDADDEVDAIIAPYMDEIIRRQAHSQELYEAYLSELGINRGDTDIAIVDPTYNGTCQYYLSRFAGISTKGYYCVANLSEDNHFITERCRLRGFYQNEDDKKAEKSLINRYTLVFESSIMISPEGSMIDIDENGFIFTPTGKTQEKFEQKEETYRGISEYCKYMSKMIQLFGLFSDEPDHIFPQKVLAMSIEGKIRVADVIKNSLYADDFYNQITDYCVAWQ